MLIDTDSVERYVMLATELVSSFDNHLSIIEELKQLKRELAGAMQKRQLTKAKGIAQEIIKRQGQIANVYAWQDQHWAAICDMRQELNGQGREGNQIHRGSDYPERQEG